MLMIRKLKCVGFILILCALSQNLWAITALKPDSTKGFSGFVWSGNQKADSITGSAIFPFAIVDSTIHQPISNSYYAFDSIKLSYINVQSSEFNHSQKTNNEFAERKSITPQKWLYYIILLLAIIVVFVKSIFTRFFVELWRSFFNLNTALQMMRQQDISFSIPGLLLLINFYIAMAAYFFLKIYQNKVQLSFNELLLIPSLMLLIIGFVLFRFSVYRLSVILFNRKSEIQTVSFIDLMHLEFTGIIMVPMILLLAFANQNILQVLWIASYIMLGAILVYRTITAWRVVGGIMFSNFFHFILYICSVEIAPVLILLKWVQQWSALK